MKKILEEVFAETKRQQELWGEQNHENGTGTQSDIISAEIARGRCDKAFAGKYGTWKDILSEEFHEAMAESDEEKLIEELTQTAAVCCSWIHAIRRRGGK